MKQVKRCRRCVMDNTSDQTIRFDSKGYCNYCSEAMLRLEKNYFPNKIGQKKLEAILSKIKKDGEGKPFDCMMGISGGLDSSYLAYLGYQWKLRILAIHIDDGFDTEISKSNIRKLCEKANIKLVTIKPDKEQYIDLIKAYMKAGVPGLAIPQDNILLACLYKYAKKNKIKYFLSGSNLSLESILQRGNAYNLEDFVNIKDIHKQFGERPINKLEFMSTYKKLLYKKIYHIQTEKLLNYVDYNKERAFKELNEFCGFEYYGSKHLENIFTAFLQLYWLPEKFKVDKRTSHLSSLIVSGQITREEALQELNKEPCEEGFMRNYLNIIKQSFGFSEEDFKTIMESPIHQHIDYKTERFLPFMRKLRNKLRKYS